MKKYALFLSVLLLGQAQATIRQLHDVLQLSKILTAVVQADSSASDYDLSTILTPEIEEKLTEKAAETDDLSITDENSKNILTTLFASHGYDIRETIESVFPQTNNTLTLRLRPNTSESNKNPKKPEVKINNNNNEVDKLTKELEKLVVDAAKQANNKCPICQETIAKKDHTIISKTCKHFICKDCKNDLKKPFVPNDENPHVTVAHKCPVCRENIDHTI